MELAGIFLSLILLIYLAYRGLSILILSPIMALVAAIFSPNIHLLATYTHIFMPAAGKFIVLYFPLFMLGALFGKLMDDSGSAEAIAKTIVKRLGPSRASLAVVLACATLTYGGVSLFVVAFTIYPIAASLFREANIPKRLIPASIALGAFTFTMTALPGTPAIQNAIPMPFFGTTPFAAPGLGIIASLCMFALGQMWITYQTRKAHLNGEGYGEEHEENSHHDSSNNKKGLPNAYVASAPIILVIVLNYVLSTYTFSTFSTTQLNETIYGSISIDSVKGVWAIICSLVIAALLVIVGNKARITNVYLTMDKGSNASLLPIFNTASLVGFGAVIATLPAFGTIQHMLENMGGNLLVTLAISVSTLAGITGSASGGMSIALEILGENYLELANKAKISSELLHRVTVIATGVLDTLPHNGAIVTLLGICGLTHKQSYRDIFFVSIVPPIIALIVLIMLGSMFGSF